jgi:sugar phosphate isomerase/epimerase
MRLGGPIHAEFDSPDAWVAAVRGAGYSAAYCPVGEEADDATVLAYAAAAEAAGVVIAEVGAWSNPLASDAEERATAMARCKARLALAERIGARCCVNIVGSRGEKWDGPCAEDLTEETFEMVVESVREIVDAVRPTRTYYTLETMPWMYPDSADSYLRLLEAIDRDGVAAHLDPVNLICSPRMYFDTGAVIRECFEKLGPRIRSCHAKDIRIEERLTLHLEEVRPGLGALDYRTFLTELAKLDPDTPLMLEHLATAEDYVAGAEHIRAAAMEAGVEIG